MVNRFLLFFTLFFSLLTTIEAKNTLKRVDINGSSLLLEFKHPLKRGEFRANAITKKDITKYYFDFKNCTLGRGAKSLYNLRSDIKSIRVGQYKDSVVRVVIDSKKSYKVKYFQKDSPIFYISLPKGVKIGKRSTKHTKKTIKKAKSKKVKSSPKELFSYVEDETIVSKSYSTNLKHNYTILIDAGHGGKDSGTVWGGVKEKEIVLSIAKRVYQKLRTLGFRVKMTRSKDSYPSLNSRIRKANKMNADLYVSIHANSIDKRKKRKANRVHGIETYFLQNTRNARARRVAAKENAQLLKEMDKTTQAVLLNTVFTGPKILLSNRLAIDVQKNILKSLRANYKGVKDNGVRGGPFYVLVGAQMPAILVEVGYLSNPKERRRLKNPKYQDKIANGIVKGIIAYLKNRERELE